MLTVSNYHYIRENFDAAYPSIFGVTPDQFRAQLQLLKNQGDFIHPDALLGDADAVLRSSDNYWLVTFDDGLKEQFDFGMPVLDALDVPAMFFANSHNCEMRKVSTVHQIHLLRSVLSPSDFLLRLGDVSLSETEQTRAASIYIYDTPETARLKYLLNFKLSFDEQQRIVNPLFEQYFSTDEVLDSLYMTAAELTVLAQKRYLGSHTHSHFPVGLLQPQDQTFELAHSKKYLENLTGNPIKMVAYPYGTAEACTDEVADNAQKSGYDLGFTTQRGANHAGQNKLLLNRFDCNDLPGGKNHTSKP